MISDVDNELGRLFDTLVSLGMWDDTMIVVTSDHGEQLGDQGLVREGRHVRAELQDPRDRRDDPERPEQCPEQRPEKCPER